MKKAMNGLYKVLDKICFVVIVVSFAVIVIILGIQIVLRKMFDAPWMWAEETCRYLFLWLLFFGGGVAFSQGGHLMVDVFFIKFPRKVQLYLLFFYYAVIIAFSGYLAYSGTLYALSQWSRPMYTVSFISLGVVDLCIPIGSVVTILYVAREMYYMMTKKEQYLDTRGGIAG